MTVTLWWLGVVDSQFPVVQVLDKGGWLLGTSSLNSGGGGWFELGEHKEKTICEDITLIKLRMKDRRFVITRPSSQYVCQRQWIINHTLDSFELD